MHKNHQQALEAVITETVISRMKLRTFLATFALSLVFLYLDFIFFHLSIH